ncbi:hypothetical protein [Pseudaminobacter sp. NGMCC 1.201702]|uniref:hypothetical protein n=1 Tax=Pseudaminobacter sp. NGMCC 1.201702 TaxID=3391825 RepID=UPI0039EE1937
MLQRVPEPGLAETTDADRLPRRLRMPVPALIVCFGMVLAVLLAAPGQTVTTKYLNDLFVFLDGAYRIAAGQVPNVDFHSSLGPLAYYIPAAGYGLSGSLAAAMPVGMGLVVLALALIAAHVVGTRMRPAIGLPLALFLLLIAAAPVNSGERITDLSFAMFYNRVGWSALGLLLVMYLPPATPSRRQTGLDVLCGAFLVLLMLYLKATYGVVALAFLALMLLDRRGRGWAMPAILTCLVAGVLVELAWGGTASHVSDLRLAARVSGGLPSFRALVLTVLRNFADVLVYCIFVLLLVVGRKRLGDLLFVGFCAATGVLLIEQNFQAAAIPTLAAGAAVAAEALARARQTERNRWNAFAPGLPLLLLVLILPASVQNGLSLGLHTGLAASRQGDEIPLRNFEGIRLARMWSDGAYPRFTRYIETLRDGAGALASLPDPNRVMVLDFVGPFSAGLGLQPPRGDSTWYHWGRTLNGQNFPPEEIFADVQIVMEPKSPLERRTANGMWQIYGAYIAAHYQLARETAFWRIYLAKSSGVDAAPRHSSAINTTRKRTSAHP